MPDSNTASSATSTSSSIDAATFKQYQDKLAQINRDLKKVQEAIEHLSEIKEMADLEQSLETVDQNLD